MELWKHRSEMKTVRSQTSDNPITFSFMFRVVQKEVWVNVDGDTLVDPKIADSTIQKFQKFQYTKHTPYYKKSRIEFDTKFEDFFTKK